MLFLIGTKWANMNESEAYNKTSHCTDVTETKKNNTAGPDIAPPSLNAHKSL